MNEEEKISKAALNILREKGKDASEKDWGIFYNDIKNIKLDNINPDLKIDILLHLGIYFKRKKLFQESKKYFYNVIDITDSYGFINRLLLNTNTINYEAFFNLAEIYSKEENFERAEECFDEILFILLSELNLSYKNDSIYLYQYRKIDKFLLQDLIEKKITLNAVKNFNDPLDSLVYHWLNENQKTNSKKEHIPPMKCSFNKIRIGSFSGDLKINKKYAKKILMWSHYAESHKGICICYKFKKEFFEKFNNKSKNEILKFAFVNYSKKHIFKNKININESFLTKFKDWIYENEIRLLYFNPNNKQDYISLEMGSDVSIEQIYFGYKCSEQDKKTLKQLFPGICKEAKINYSENKDIYSSIEFINSK